MGDKHVCSFCDENLEGKQHIKIVFENWPIEEEVTYRRKGKEAKRTRKVTKEVITAIGMECINNPDKWKDYEIEPSKVSDFFEDLRFAGKNPIFNAVLTKAGPVCLSPKCIHRTGNDCQHLLRYASQWLGLDELACEVGHPGRILLRRGKEKRLGLLSPFAALPASGRQKWWKIILDLLTFNLNSSNGPLTRFYLILSYSIPMAVFISFYLLIIYPFWGVLCLKNKIELLRGK